MKTNIVVISIHNYLHVEIDQTRGSFLIPEGFKFRGHAPNNYGPTVFHNVTKEEFASIVDNCKLMID